MATKLVAPFPYYGGKRRYTKQIWEWLGDPQAYVEPFCGSAAVLLQRPESSRPRRRELINDSSGWVANFWRAVKHDPGAVASWADWPNSQVELSARQQWFDDAALISVNDRLRADPVWFDAKLAGVWAWGVSCSITMMYPDGRLGTQGFTLGYRGANQRHIDLAEWCQRLADRLKHVQIHAGDWQLCLTKSAHMNGAHTVGVFLDPPYDPNKSNSTMYEHGDTWTETAEWAFDKGQDPNYRIILCGYTGSYDMPDGWTFQPLGNIGLRKREAGKTRMAEGAWLSPACNTKTADDTLWQPNKSDTPK